MAIVFVLEYVVGWMGWKLFINLMKQVDTIYNVQLSMLNVKFSIKTIMNDNVSF